MSAYDLLKKTARTARKQHKCIWCDEPILAGEGYIDERSVYDYRIQAFKWHPECWEARGREAAVLYEDDLEWDAGEHRRGMTISEMLDNTD